MFFDSPHPPVKVGGVFIIKRQPRTSELCSPEHLRSARARTTQIFNCQLSIINCKNPLKC